MNTKTTTTMMIMILDALQTFTDLPSPRDRPSREKSRSSGITKDLPKTPGPMKMVLYCITRTCLLSILRMRIGSST